MARVVVVGWRLRRPRLGRPAGQARPRRDPRRAVAAARRRARPSRPRTGSPGTPGRRPRCCPPCSATCSASPAGRSSGSSSSSRCRRYPRAPVRGRHVGPAARRVPGGPARRARRARPRARPALGRPRRVVRRRLGDRCAAATSRCRGTPTTVPPRAGRAAGQPRDAAQAAEARTSRTSGCG